MITGESLDRRFWIGASDTHMVMARRDSKAFQSWWQVKTGLAETNGGGFSNRYTIAGDMYEKPIANAFGEEITEDRTIALPDYSLRVNLDADTPGKIIECKTFKESNGRLDIRSQSYRRYYMQIQVQLFAWAMAFGEEIEAEMRIYYLNDSDYDAALRGTYIPLDYDRLEQKPISYNKAWIETMYLPNLMPLAKLLKEERECS